jgi:hypothetical protein
VISTLITTVSPAASSDQIAFLGLAAVLTLLVFLVMKELATLSKHPRLTFLGQRSDVAILPLLFVFSFIVIDKVLHILV